MKEVNELVPANFIDLFCNNKEWKKHWKNFIDNIILYSHYLAYTNLYIINFTSILENYKSIHIK